MTKWGEDNGIEFLTMTLDRAEEGLEVLRNGFFEEEASCISIGVAEEKAGQRELEHLALECAKDMVSIMAVHKETNKIVGVCYNKYQESLPPGQKSFFEEFRDTKSITKSGTSLINKMMWFDSKINLYDKYEADCSLELMFLATHRDFRRRGVAIGCVAASLALVRTLPSPLCPMKPQIATGIFTSPYSIRVGRIHSFDEVIHIPIHELVFDGKPFSDNPKVGKDHPGYFVMVKKI